MTQQFGVHRTRVDRHYPHTAVRHFLAQVFGDGADREFAAHIGGVVGEALLAGDGADVEDGTPATADHIRKHRLNPVQQAQYVHIEHALPLDRILGVQLPQQHDTGIVDQKIRRAVDGFGFPDRLNKGLGVGHIHRATQGVWQVKGFNSVQAPGQKQQGVTCL